jgi:hypothetical protein
MATPLRNAEGSTESIYFKNDLSIMVHVLFDATATLSFIPAYVSLSFTRFRGVLNALN